MLVEIREGLQQLAAFEKGVETTMRESAADTKLASDGADVLNARFNSLVSTVKVLAGSFVALKIAGFIRESIGAAGEAEDAMARVEAAIDATGGAAKRSAEDIAKIADRIRDTTTFTDEEVLGLSNTLLGFTNIIGKTFDRAVEDVVDLSAKTRRGVEEIAMAVGKALDAPKEGLDGLARMGVRFTEAQKGVIEKLVDTGRTAEAQGIILAELERRAKGTAAALNDELGGALKNLKDDYGELQEAFGQGLGEGLVSDAQEVSQSLRDMQPAARDAGIALGALLQLAGKFGQVWTPVSGAFRVFIGLVLEGFAGAFSVMSKFEAGVARSTAKLIELAKNNTVIGGLLNLTGNLDKAIGSLRSFADETEKGSAGLQEFADSALESGMQQLDRWAAGVDKGRESLGGLGDTTDKLRGTLPALATTAKTAGSALGDGIAAGADKAKVSLEQALEAARKLVEQRGADFAGSKPSDVAGLGEQKAGLQGTIAALRQKQEQSGLTAEELGRLTAAEDELSTVERELQVTTLDVNRAIESQAQEIESLGNKTKPTAAQLAQLANDLEAAGHNFGGLEQHLSDLDPEFDKHNESVKESVSDLSKLNKEVTATGIEFKEAGFTITEHTDAVAGLAERQKDGLGPMVEYGNKVGEAAGQTKDAAKETKKLEENVVEANKAMKEMTSPEMLKAIDALAAKVRNDLLPAFRELRDCINDTGVG